MAEIITPESVETSLYKKYKWVIALDHPNLCTILHETHKLLLVHCIKNKKDVSSLSVCLFLFENIEDTNINEKNIKKVLKKCPLVTKVPIYINDKHYYNLCKSCGLNIFRYYPSNDCRILMFTDEFNLKTNEIKFHFTNLSNSRHDHSYTIHKFLHDNDLLKNSIWSYCNKRKEFELNYNKYLNYSDSDYQLFSENFISGENDIHLMTKKDLEPHFLSAITLNKETVFHGHGPHYSEKLIKCLATGRPFIEISCPYTLSDLKKHLGIKTFPELIDEKYDSIVDPFERMEFIQREIIRLSKKPLKELIKYIYDYERKFKYNYDLIHELWDQSTDFEYSGDPLVLE